MTWIIIALAAVTGACGIALLAAGDLDAWDLMIFAMLLLMYAETIDRRDNG